MSITNDREVLLCLLIDFGQYWRGTAHCIAFPYLYNLRQKVEVSIPCGVIGFFHWLHSGYTIDMGSTQPLTNRNEYQGVYPGVKAAGA
jgi:hypothetical protein